MTRSPQSAALRRRKRDSTTQSVDFLNTVMHTSLPARSEVNPPKSTPHRTRRTTLAGHQLSRDDFGEIPPSPEPGPASEPRRRVLKNSTIAQSPRRNRPQRSVEIESSTQPETPEASRQDCVSAEADDGNISDEGEDDNIEEDEDASGLTDFPDNQAGGNANGTEIMEIPDDGSSEDGVPLDLFSEEEVAAAQRVSNSPSTEEDKPSVRQWASMGSVGSNAVPDTGGSENEQGHASEAEDSSRLPCFSPSSDSASDASEELGRSSEDASENDYASSPGLSSADAYTRADRRGMAEKGSSPKSMNKSMRRRTQAAAAAAALASTSRKSDREIRMQEPKTLKSSTIATRDGSSSRDKSRSGDSHATLPPPPSPLSDSSSEPSDDNEYESAASDSGSYGSGNSDAHHSSVESSPISSPRKRKRTGSSSRPVRATLSPGERGVVQATHGSPSTRGIGSSASARSWSRSDEGSEPLEGSGDELDFLADSPWFQKASKANHQQQNWKAIIRHARKLNELDPDKLTARLDPIRNRIYSLFALYRNLVERARCGEGPSENEVGNCHEDINSVRRIQGELRDEVYLESQQGPAAKKRVMALVNAFYTEIIPPMARVVLLCYEVSQIQEKLFAEAYQYFQDTLIMLSEWCLWTDALSEWLCQVSCVESELRRALGKLIQALNQRELQKRPRPRTPQGKKDEPPSVKSTPWTEQEEKALIIGLRKYPARSTNRCKLIMNDFRHELRNHTFKTMREKCKEMYSVYVSQLREQLETEEGQQKWNWVLTIPGSR
ncbi:uncharacterized protein BP01DRAFT_424460 [Aspergillus saccharolyticus JOP 1030-1]|uniref:Uncharacterized protein n=1 Tax=Aspergillus saccharolyticus JOP 1030-1 TaxID=1450539 RepID=A0A318ZCY5_9EURO|nr:hypothetical protein BP01DRAFT_424460 [Aspergillus saccharolyticus JOP 1030-1]PYH44164.1 hypothetical protein BP01DRAFT_424460 [Aspergillus saccharolyticus JOP 1030-1]